VSLRGGVPKEKRPGNGGWGVGGGVGGWASGEIAISRGTGPPKLSDARGKKDQGVSAASTNETDKVRIRRDVSDPGNRNPNSERKRESKRT